VRRPAALALALAALALAGCGDDDEASSGEKPVLTVSAAASLTEAFDTLKRDYDGALLRFSFAGSDELAAQIRKGVKPDVFAAANTKLPEALAEEGLVEKPVAFASNELVLAVPAQGGVVRSPSDLARPGLKLAIGAASVPVGEYTRRVLSGLPVDERRAILANVRSEEPDVKGVVGKVAQGAADAGFVYRSDVDAAGGRLKAISLPKRLDPEVAYGVAVVKGAKQPEAARGLVRSLLRGQGARALRDAAIGPPPS
jgi:molybdate transport system substrate-binding protein